jgi:hypothetical protein
VSDSDDAETPDESRITLPNRREYRALRRAHGTHADRQPRIMPLVAVKGIGGPKKRKRSRS